MKTFLLALLLLCVARFNEAALTCGDGVIDPGEQCDSGRAPLTSDFSFEGSLNGSSWVINNPGKNRIRVALTNDGNIGTNSSTSNWTPYPQGANALKVLFGLTKLPMTLSQTITLPADTLTRADGYISFSYRYWFDTSKSTYSVNCTLPKRVSFQLGTQPDETVFEIPCGSSSTDSGLQVFNSATKFSSVGVTVPITVTFTDPEPYSGFSIIMLDRFLVLGLNLTTTGCDPNCQPDPYWNCTTTNTCAPICGDGYIVPGNETCDDGNANSGDGCNSNCIIEPGWTCPRANVSCYTNVCGDGSIGSGETCDDGNRVAGDGCNATCIIEPGYNCPIVNQTCVGICGDGIKLPIEGCDDGNLNAGDGCNSTCAIETGYTCPTAGSPCVTVCGDRIRLGNETCDDGNAISGDGCASNCTIEIGYNCTVVGVPCIGICGDRIKVASEGCDDGNRANSDGCSSTCTIETGWNCTSNQNGNTVFSTCAPVCGNGIITIPESCDDGNTIAGDGCSSTCQIETGWICRGTGPSVCTPNDAIRPSTSNDDDGLSAGAIAGIVIACVCCCCFIIIVVIIIMAIGKKKRDKPKKNDPENNARGANDADQSPKNVPVVAVAAPDTSSSDDSSSRSGSSSSGSSSGSGSDSDSGSGSESDSGSASGGAAVAATGGNDSEPEFFLAKPVTTKKLSESSSESESESDSKSDSGSSASSGSSGSSGSSSRSGSSGSSGSGSSGSGSESASSSDNEE